MLSRLILLGVAALSLSACMVGPPPPKPGPQAQGANRVIPPQPPIDAIRPKF